MKFKEARMIRSDEVKAMCIKDGFYTCGTYAEYCHLLFDLSENKDASLEDLEEIATDILDHSDWEKKASEYGTDRDELLRIVMTNLLNECCYTFIEKAEA